jgi:hypothetical protein
MATTNAIITARKGTLANIPPTLLPGELYLATDYQRVFMGQEPVTGVCDTTASTNTTAIVEFKVGGNVIDMDLMVPLNDYTYNIVVNPDTDNLDKPGSVIAFTDSKASFPHGLVDTGSPPAARVPTNSDVFVLYYNKEVSYHAEAFPNPTQEISFTASASGVAQATGVEFLCENKDSVTIDYTLKPANGPSRHGTLNILLDNNANVPTSGTIKDEYDIGVVHAGSFAIGKDYNIKTLGTATQAEWNTTAGTSAVTYAVGDKFTAANIGTGTGTASLIETPVEFSLTDNGTDKFILNFKTTDTVNAHTFTYVQKSFK